MSDLRRVIVSHEYYGCETGCCGHVVYIDAKIGDYEVEGTQVGDFEFMHGRVEDDPVAYARKVCEEELGAKHCADLDWDNCVLVMTDKCY